MDFSAMGPEARGVCLERLVSKTAVRKDIG